MQGYVSKIYYFWSSCFICRIKKDEKARLAELESIVKEKDVKSKMILDEKKYATKAVCIFKQTFIPISKALWVTFPKCFVEIIN